MWQPYICYKPLILVQCAEARYGREGAQPLVETYKFGEPMADDDKLYRETFVSLLEKVWNPSMPEWVSICIVNAVREATYKDEPRAWGEFSFRIAEQVGCEDGVFEDSPVADRLIRMSKECGALRDVLYRTFGKEPFL